MLPSELLVAKVRGGMIRPVYLSITGETMRLAEELISVYSRDIGKKRGEILKSTRELEGRVEDFRVVRGLCTLIERRAVFETRSPIDPSSIREAVFEAGVPVLDEGLRSRALAGAAKKLGISPDDVQRYMWSDLMDEKVLASLDPPSPEELIAAYNLSLTQTLVFKSTSIELKLGGNIRRLLGAVKRLGLMYTITGEGDRMKLSVEGPASTIKLTERYGTAVAKLLPEVFALGSWEIRSQILVKSFGRRRLLGFELSSSDAPPLPTPLRQEVEEYDSSVEEAFAKRFRALGTGWTLVREPGVVQTPAGVIIPDFALEKVGRRIYMEIVGFWTPQYLEKKVKKLRSMRGADVIVAVDSKLAVTDTLNGNLLNVIEFDREIPLRPVLSVLEKAEGELLEKDLEKVSRLEILPSEDVVEIPRLAAAMGVSQEALTARLCSSPPHGYRVFGGYLISEKLVEGITGALSKGGSLKEVGERLGGFGITDPLPILREMGYSVRWRGLSPESAEVTRDGDNH